MISLARSAYNIRQNADQLEDTGTAALVQEVREGVSDHLHLHFDELKLLSAAEAKSQEQYIEKAIDEAASKGSEDPFLDVFSFEPGPIKDYRLPYAFYIAGEEHVEITPELQEGIQQEIEKMEKALELGVVDETRPLDDVRRRSFRKQIESFNEKDYPVAIPREISEMECSVFGHICPVVFVGGDVSETSQERRKNRYIPFQTKARVVRRDNYTCQECGKHLRDNEVEFDHIIPLSKGGSSEEHNIRLTCFECNRSKSDSVDI